MFVDLQASFKNVLAEWAKEKQLSEYLKTRQDLVQSECTVIQKQFLEFVEASSASMIEKETSNLLQADQIAQLTDQLEQKAGLEELVTLKSNEIELLKEYKRRKELESEELRLSGGYEEASKPLRKRSPGKGERPVSASADQASNEELDRESKGSVIREQILAKIQEQNSLLKERLHREEKQSSLLKEQLAKEERRSHRNRKEKHRLKEQIRGMHAEKERKEQFTFRQGQAGKPAEVLVPLAPRPGTASAGGRGNQNMPQTYRAPTQQQ